MSEQHLKVVLRNWVDIDTELELETSLRVELKWDL